MEVGVVHLLEASIKLNCSLEVTARSLLLYHHFRRCAAEIICDEDVIAAGALHLGSRLYEQIIDLDSLICVFFSIVNRTSDILISDDGAYILLKKTLIALDFMMLRMFEFNLNHRLAHQYLVPFLAMIYERSKNIADFHGELGRTCIRFLSDFYTQQICLEFSPELIAAACIDLSLHVHGLINDLTMIPEWYMGFIFQITPEKVREIKRIIMSLYEIPKRNSIQSQFLRTLEEQVAKIAQEDAEAEAKAKAAAEKAAAAKAAAAQGHHQIQQTSVQWASQTPVAHGLPTPIQHSLPTPMQHGLPTPMQHGVPTPMQHGVPIPMQHGLPIPMQHGLPIPMQHGLPIPMQHGLPIPMQHGLPTPMQHVLPIPMQVPRIPMQVPPTPTQLLPTRHVLPPPRQQFLPTVQKFLPTHLQHVESMDIADSSVQKN